MPAWDRAAATEGLRGNNNLRRKTCSLRACLCTAEAVVSLVGPTCPVALLASEETISWARTWQSPISLSSAPDILPSQLTSQDPQSSLAFFLYAPPPPGWEG